MEEKVIIKSKLKNIRPICLSIGLSGLIIFALYVFYSAATFRSDATFLEGVEYTFRGNGATIAVLPLIFVMAVIGLVLYSRWSKVELTVTDRRVYGNDSSGKRVDLPLDSVSAIGLTKKSTISVTTASGSIKFTYLENANEIHEAVSKLLVNRQSNHSAAPNGIPQSAADELEKYKKLLDSGTITQAEFDAKKKQLLGL